jgi:hypothetical protein
MSEHTPGSWQYHRLLSRGESHGGFRISTGVPKWWSIAAVNPIDGAGVEGEANARLISAAPDLLAALEKVWAEGVIPDGFALLQDQVCDAIAKAGGAK